MNTTSEVQAGKAGRREERSIGRLLLDAGVITAEGAEKALRLHKERGIHFGEACVELGLVTSDDIRRALASQFDYPYVRPGQGNLNRQLIAAYEPFSDQVEALRAIRTHLLLRWFAPDRRKLAVVSSGRRDGRSYLAANLAIVFSQLGERTLLIDADMRAPRQHELFGLPGGAGLSGLLSGRTSSESHVHRIADFANLCVLTAGAEPPNPLELISRPEFETALDDFSRDYEVVIVDTPSVTWGADAKVIAARCGGAMLVARMGRSRVRALQDLTRSLTSTGTEIVGSVANDH